MLEGLGLLARKREHLFHPRGVGNIPRHLGFGAGANLLLDFLPDGLRIEAHLLKDIHRHALTELDQAKQKVLRADIVMIEPVCFLAGKGQYLLGAWCEIIHHDSSLIVVVVA